MLTFPNVRPEKHNRFSHIPKPGEKFDISKIFRAHLSDKEPDPKPADQFTLEEAKTKLRDDGMVVMTQKAFDGIIDEKYQAAYKKAKEDADKSAPGDEKLKKENEDLKTKIAELEKDKPDVISKAEHEKLLQVERDKLTEKDQAIEKLRSQQKEAAIFKAATGSVDPETVVALLRDKFKIDETGAVYPVDEKGERLIGKEGHTTPEQFINDFLKEKPHLAKDASSPGTGSKSETGGNPKDGGKTYNLDQLSEMTDEQYIKAGGLSAASN
jgi:hypothetical protein